MHFEDLSNEAVFNQHASLLITIANSIVLEPQRRKFVIDERNKELLRFLLYYFNDCQLAEQVFPNKRYKLHKNLLIHGNVGTGKTLIMQIFMFWSTCRKYWPRGRGTVDSWRLLSVICRRKSPERIVLRLLATSL